MRAEHHAFHGDAAFLGVAFSVEFAQVALQQVVLVGFVAIHVHALTEAVGEHFHLLVDELVVNSDVVVVELVLAVELNLELRSHSHIEHESVRSGLLQIDSLMLCL